MQNGLELLLRHLQQTENPESILVFVPIKRTKYVIENLLKINILPEMETLPSFLQKFSLKPDIDDVHWLAVTENLLRKHFKKLEKGNTPFFAEILLAEVRNVLVNLSDLQKIQTLKSKLSLTGFMQDPEARENLARRLGVYAEKSEYLGEEFVAFLQEFLKYTENYFLYEAELHSFLQNPRKIESLLATFREIVFYDFSYIPPAEKQFLQQLISLAEKLQIPVKFFASIPFQNYFFFKNTFLASYKEYVETPSLKIPETKTVYLPEKNARIKLLGKFLQEIPDDKEVLIITTDENVLFELLNSIPEKFQKINPSIALKYSFFKATQLLRLISECLSASEENSGKFFVQLLDLLFPEALQARDLNNLQITSEFFEKLKELLQNKPRDAKEFRTFWENLLNLFYEESLQEDSEIFNALEKQVIGKIRENYQRFAEVLLLQNQAQIPRLLRFFLYWLEKQKIFFTGRSWEGLQILTLNGITGKHYDYVFLLFADYDELPKKFSRKDLILPQIKYELEFFTPNDYAKKDFYAFFSAFMNSDKFVSFAKSPEEESHFLKMLRTFVVEPETENPKLPELPVQYEIQIALSPQDIQRWKQKLREKGISYSMVQQYFQAPEAFFLERLMEINLKNEADFIYFDEEKKLRKLETIIEPDAMGEMFHRMLVQIFQVEQTSQNLLKIVEENVSAYVSEEKYRPVYVRIAKKILQKVLEEHQAENYAIQALEKNLKVPINEEFFLTGTIDRIDFKDGILRIIDYKTGAEKQIAKEQTPASVLKNVFTSEEASAKDLDILQLLMYLVLVSENLPNLNLSYEEVREFRLYFWNLGKTRGLGAPLKIPKEEVSGIKEKLLYHLTELLRKKWFVGEGIIVD